VSTKEAIEAVWRIESARLIGGLVRVVRDVDLAEDLAHDALVVALEHWPKSGIPQNPGAWLITTAKHRAVDRLRRDRTLANKYGVLGDDARAGPDSSARDMETAIDEEVGDDLLRLVLMTCHRVLTAEARVALTLRLLGGLTTDEIARAFLVQEPTVAQRIVRAKRTLAEARVPFEVPRGAELAARLPSILEVIYLIFNEGYAATWGDAWIRQDLCEDALRLGRILAGLVGQDAETHGLIALMELQASRARARVGPSGNEPTLTAYHLLPAVRADLLYKLGRTEEAQKDFERAAHMAQNSRERELLLARARACLRNC
jgi:RNA polymerase sigma factor (sigma-70 family)